MRHEARNPFVLSVTAKEAIKTALAFTLVYWIALKSACKDLTDIDAS